MPETEPTTRSRKIGRSGIWWIVACGLLFALCFPLGWVDDATELTPDHSDIITLCFALGLVAALVGSFVMWRAADTLPTRKRPGATLVSAVLSFLAVALVLLPASDLSEGWVDFPPSKTATFRGVLVRVDRAYQTHGKSRSWNIQTTPLWSNIDITEDDYDGMLSHRSPEDAGTDPDEITSRGYFCAKVSVQKAGDAIRILHAGGGALPRRSIL